MEQPNIIASAKAENKGEIYATNIWAGNHQFMADEPKEFGGKEAGASPIDYLCMALASCKAITIRMYVQRKQWQLHEVTVNVKLIKGDATTSGRSSFFCEVLLTGALNEEQEKRVLAISKACPVDRMLSRQNEVITVLNKKTSA